MVFSHTSKELVILIEISILFADIGRFQEIAGKTDFGAFFDKPKCLGKDVMNPLPGGANLPKRALSSWLRESHVKSARVVLVSSDMSDASRRQ